MWEILLIKILLNMYINESLDHLPPFQWVNWDFLLNSENEIFP